MNFPGVLCRVKVKMETHGSSNSDPVSFRGYRPDVRRISYDATRRNCPSHRRYGGSRE